MTAPGAITITAFKWVPPFAQGQVRDHRLRWILKEVGWAYSVDLIDPTVQNSEAYVSEQPFGQVPVLCEKGRPTLFETGAILLDIAERSGKLLPSDPDQHALARCWMFAALNSVEPYLMEIALADHFIDDKALAQGYRAFALPLAQKQLRALSVALGERDWLVGDQFSVADLLMASVTKVVHDTDLIEEQANLAAWRDRCFARPAYRAAIAEQCAEIAAHGPQDMGWPDQSDTPSQEPDKGESA